MTQVQAKSYEPYLQDGRHYRKTFYLNWINKAKAGLFKILKLNYTQNYFTSLIAWAGRILAIPLILTFQQVIIYSNIRTYSSSNINVKNEIIFKI